MPYNYLSLVNDVCKELNEVELTTPDFSSAVGAYAQIKSSVNSSLNDINQSAFEWPFNHQTETLVLTADQVRYPFPSDVKSINFDSFRVVRDPTLNVATTKLTRMDYEEYLDKYADAEYVTDGSHSGVPRYVFMAPDLTFGVYPSPRAAYTLVYEYYRLPLELENATDVPSLPEQFKHVIKDGALYYAFMFRGDPESSAVMLQKQQKGISQMRAIYQNRFEYLRAGK